MVIYTNNDFLPWCGTLDFCIGFSFSLHMTMAEYNDETLTLITATSIIVRLLFLYCALAIHSAAFLCSILKKNTASGCKVHLFQFFALISNLKSEFKNLRHVFFKCHFNFLMPDYELIRWSS